MPIQKYVNRTESASAVLEIIYAVGANVKGDALNSATVLALDYLPTVITSRMGDTINVSDDALDSLIIALQEVKRLKSNGQLKKK
jgi:hypothetical protein